MRVTPYFTNIIKCDHCENVLTDWDENNGFIYFDNPIRADIVAHVARTEGWYVRYEGHEPFLSCPECHGGPIGS